MSLSCKPCSGEVVFVLVIRSQEYSDVTGNWNVIAQWRACCLTCGRIRPTREGFRDVKFAYLDFSGESLSFE